MTLVGRWPRTQRSISCTTWTGTSMSSWDLPGRSFTLSRSPLSALLRPLPKRGTCGQRVLIRSSSVSGRASRATLRFGYRISHAVPSCTTPAHTRDSAVPDRTERIRRTGRLTAADASRPDGFWRASRTEAGIHALCEDVEDTVIALTEIPGVPCRNHHKWGCSYVLSSPDLADLWSVDVSVATPTR